MPRRAHTGRRRNEAAREAILAAAADLLARDDTAISVGAIAAAAGVGKQTIYRWWPSKGAVLLEAAIERAQELTPRPDTGSFAGDLETFLVATFETVSAPPVRALLRTSMAEALRDPAAADALRAFTLSRREMLLEILDRAGERGEADEGTDRHLFADQAFGVLWYRVLLGHDPLTPAAARALAANLVRSCGSS
ncbi:hypothetical protein GCM10027445_08380 [Amycolatopsis endophytica]|uniref:AcrR family transcriptional regulator n=1 Tax=Amycolatopsis endophytica TaxID=860233 RepID=A0A853AWR4_9PSEU|nr:TetR-like C-terminal domain-containing protein [Amycolatopsis endophytica]NYI87077.1 AcrR family transcriptional regulator [Amycolatopsis endophytica]